MRRRHLLIPDGQVKPGECQDHWAWIGQYIVDKRPDVVINIGDFYDMHSLSSYDKGKKSYEGRRYDADIEAGDAAFAVLTAPIERELRLQERRWRDAERRALATGMTQEVEWWIVELLYCLGNHEDRIVRAYELEPGLFGKLSLADLGVPKGWKTFGFLEPVTRDGIKYCHYFYNANNGRPLAGQARTMLNQLGHSFTMGHRQVKEIAEKPIIDGIQRGLVVGACYLHDEKYKGPQGNNHFRGLIVKNEVADGNYMLTEVTLDYLCRRYEGVELSEYLTKNGYGHYSLAKAGA